MDDGNYQMAVVTFHDRKEENVCLREPYLGINTQLIVPNVSINISRKCKCKVKKEYGETSFNFIHNCFWVIYSIFYGRTLQSL